MSDSLGRNITDDAVRDPQPRVGHRGRIAWQRLQDKLTTGHSGIHDTGRRLRIKPVDINRDYGIADLHTHKSDGERREIANIKPERAISRICRPVDVSHLEGGQYLPQRHLTLPQDVPRRIQHVRAIESYVVAKLRHKGSPQAMVGPRIPALQIVHVLRLGECPQILHVGAL